MNQKEVTQTNFSTRLRVSGVFATISSVVIGASQVFSGQSQNQVLLSAGVEGGTTFVTSLINQSVYNCLKKQIQKNTQDVDTTSIEIISAVLVSIFGVGAPRLLLHQSANTEGSLPIAVIYSILNIVVMMLYEKKVLQRNPEK